VRLYAIEFSSLLSSRNVASLRSGKNWCSTLGNPKVPRQQSGLPTLDGYNLKGIELQDLLIKVSREDLGIE
jgi:hypothetical protein